MKCCKKGTSSSEKSLFNKTSFVNVSDKNLTSNKSFKDTIL